LITSHLRVACFVLGLLSVKEVALILDFLSMLQA